jgi:peroxiredoxin Q/BCP
MGLRSRVISAVMNAGGGTKLKVGDPAPELGARDAHGKTWTLADLRGKPAVIYFYPKDDTPGCTKEACSFRDSYARFSGATLLGVSRDAAPSHSAFAQKFNLPFPLLADEDGAIVKRYDVVNLLGQTRRVTFVLDKAGRIARIFDPVTVEGHTPDVLAAVNAAR